MKFGRTVFFLFSYLFRRLSCERLSLTSFRLAVGSQAVVVVPPTGTTISVLRNTPSTGNGQAVGRARRASSAGHAYQPALRNQEVVQCFRDALNTAAETVVAKVERVYSTMGSNLVLMTFPNIPFDLCKLDHWCEEK